MDGPTDGWMDGWTDGWMDPWMDGWMDGRDLRTDRLTIYICEDAFKNSVTP